MDDTQWADQLSLSLIQLLLAQQHLVLLIISAYRSNEVDPQHPLMVMLQQAQVAAFAAAAAAPEAKVFSLPVRPASGEFLSCITTIQLEPLNVLHCAELVADTLLCTPLRARPLAEVLHQQTGGSPFFFVLLLSSYEAHSWITFDWQLREWQWDLRAVRLDKIGSLDSVVALLQPT